MVTMRSLTSTTLAGATALLLVGSTGCASGDGTGSDSDVRVITSVYPLEWLTREVGGDPVVVEQLTEPGTDPHDLELTPRQIGEIGDADLVFSIEGMQPAVDDAVAQHAADTGLDAADLVELREVPAEEGGGTDPHVWLDLERMRILAEGLAERLAEVDPEHAADYRDNAAEVGADLDELDTDYSAGLTDCADRTLVVSHAAFGYLADRYDLEQIGISGLEPESEPSPARIRQVAELVEESGATTVFTEVLASPRVVEILAEETGADTAVLDPLEGITDQSPGDDYPSVMRANLDALRDGLDCA